MLVGREILLVQGLVELPEHVVGIDEGFKLGALDKLLFIALPAVAIEEIVIEGAVFVSMLKVQSAGFDSVLNVQEEQSLVEGNAELAVLTDGYPFLGIQEADGRRFIDSAIFLFEVLDGVH